MPLDRLFFCGFTKTFSGTLELYYHITMYFTMFTFTNSKKEQTLVKVTQNNYKANRAE